MRTVITFFAFSLFFSVILCIPGAKLYNADLQVQFDNMDASGLDSCQSCYDFTLTEDDTDTWSFRFIYSSFAELDSSGDQCCSFIDNNCFFGTGCDQHTILSLPDALNATNNTTETITYSGIYSTGGDVGVCVPPSSSGELCAYFNFDYQIINDATNITVGDFVYDLPANVIKQTIKVSTWKFATGSTGFRLILGAGISQGLLRGSYVNGVKTTTTQTHIERLDIQSVSRYASVKFPFEALLDGTTWKNVTDVSGPYSSGDPQMNYYYVDVPSFSIYGIYIFYLREH